MSTIWILIMFFGEARGGVAAAEFSNEKSCRAAIVSATLAAGTGYSDRVRGICVPKEIK